VLPDGRISFPLADGAIQAAGRTPEQLQATLEKRLQPHFKTDVDVEVMVLGIAADQQIGTIYVTGEVRNPGQFPIKEPTTLMQAIALAGGFDRFAAKYSIKVHRKRSGRDFYHTFNYYNFAAGRDEAGNITLKDGDVVIVPERGIFGFLFELFE